MTTTLTANLARLLHTISESQEQLGGIGRSTIYELIAKGEIRVVKIGRRTFIAHDELTRYAHSLTDKGGAAA